MDEKNEVLLDVSPFLLVEGSADSEADYGLLKLCQDVTIACDDDGDAESCSCDTSDTLDFHEEYKFDYDDDQDYCGDCNDSSRRKKWLRDGAAGDYMATDDDKETEEESKVGVNVISREVMDEMEDRLFWETCMAVSSGHKHKVMFHHKGCPNLEKIARNITWSRVDANRALAAKLLRLHYHDCFVRWCDASTLLDHGIPRVEKDAGPNRSVSRHDVNDEMKAKLEDECSEMFKKPLWPVFIGRKDGKVSSASEADRDLPSPEANFSNNNLNAKD